MSLLSQLVINGIIAGSIYALVASGFSLIYGTAKFMHFAHGITVITSGYLFYTFFKILSFPFFISIILSIILTSFLGWFIYISVYSNLEKRNASNVIMLISSIAILILFQNIIQIFFGAGVKTFGLETRRGVEFLGASITPLQIIIISMSLVIFLSLFIFMKKSPLGKKMRAVSDNKTLALIVGINQKKVIAISFLLGSLIAGIAGVLVGLEQNLTPTAGTNLIIKGFSGAVIGGISSVSSSVLGSYMLGLLENLGIWFLPSGFKDAIAFALLFIFILFKPSGLFGIRKEAKNE